MADQPEADPDTTSPKSELGFASVADAESYLGTRFDDLDAASKKDQIVALKKRFYGKITRKTVAEAVDCTGSYVSKVGWSPGEGETRWERPSEEISETVRNDVLDRDGRECVDCGAETNLQVHHIRRGESTPSNLATLCRDCHKDVHGGSWHGVLPYQSVDEFWDLVDG